MHISQIQLKDKTYNIKDNISLIEKAIPKTNEENTIGAVKHYLYYNNTNAIDNDKPDLMIILGKVSISWNTTHRFGPWISITTLVAYISSYVYNSFRAYDDSSAYWYIRNLKAQAETLQDGSILGNDVHLEDVHLRDNQFFFVGQDAAATKALIGYTLFYLNPS